ncbi:aminoacyl-tRNA hydrolase [Corynebacterium pelargi]|uniref:Peptidyl-tRNA hydrolase n=1 Tax=Corynebacterium pelargi TaxID=1471400 RepID=A0A410W9U9_9CORY|nr:aminoacyl-tRNA hydrolase [Corynebacterium pelargi]QAU52734.1 Peptidyl-tRNA hydrolase [Corynebacterium pelargi]GGG78441.1 peptidyl-tRNA hydrolase 1 [Corynebacterium pelargi]
MHVIVGLGNPGPKYEGTRHNIGAAALKELAERYGMGWSNHKRSNCAIAQGRIANNPVLLARPRSMMNLSGQPLKTLMQFYKLSPAQLIVLFDDLELDFGDVRARSGGGDHGHKGLRSISQQLGTKEYHKVGIGIGRPPGRMDVASFVLKPFSKAEQASVPIVLADAADAAEALLHP